MVTVLAGTRDAEAELGRADPVELAVQRLVVEARAPVAVLVPGEGGLVQAGLDGITASPRVALDSRRRLELREPAVVAVLPQADRRYNARLLSHPARMLGRPALPG